MELDKDALELRSLGEAHLYLAVAKADGSVSTLERVRAPYLAGESQKHYNLFGINKALAAQIKRDTAQLFADEHFMGWNALMHIDEGLRLLHQAREAGAQGLDLTAVKLEQELRELAYLDGYDMRESRFMSALLERLQAFGDASGRES